jgi:hypothetical protein
MDELDFAREQLRRAMLEWANITLPRLLDSLDQHEDELKAVIDGLLLTAFPAEEFKEYRDLVVARLQTLKAEREQ